ncbi:UPF0179 family protein [Candidatus Bathyarchaeota archaeon]|nr:UPF0179 family protein [Candidatus Bathyarchaeota archaeon]
MGRITIVGKNQAKVGYAFLFNKPSSICIKCKYYKPCMGGLEAGRVYIVKKVLNKVFECKLHFEEGNLVEVDEADIEANIDAKLAILEAIIDFHAIKCRNVSCENYFKCAPLGLRNGDKCKIVEVYEKVTCPLGAPLSFVRLHRLSFHSIQ